jgi:hypothetical protein
MLLTAGPSAKLVPLAGAESQMLVGNLQITVSVNFDVLTSARLML